MIRFVEFSLIAALVAVSSTQANAALIIKIEDGIPANTVTVYDQDFVPSLGTDPDGEADTGVVQWNGSLGGFDFLLSVGFGAPALAVGHLDLLQGAVTYAPPLGGGSGMVTISVTQTDLNSPPTFPGFQFGVGGTSDGLVDVAAYYDETNAEFGEGTLISSGADLTGSPFSDTGAVTIPGGTADPYSLTIVSTISHAGAGITTFDAKITPAPEPASIISWMVIMLSALGFVGFRRRRYS